METLMSKGPGRIERAIEAAFAADPDNAFTTEELCERAYFPAVNLIEKKHRVAVVRAGKRLAERMERFSWFISERLGNELGPVRA
jgi:hypothetical protein